VLIRCERCQAVFSLPEGILRPAAVAPAAADTPLPASIAVECGRCLHRFKVRLPLPG
jgi:hypothetical protein